MKPRVQTVYLEFSVRAFPIATQVQLKEYALISDFFIKDPHPGPTELPDSEHLKKELLFKKLSITRDIVSLVITSFDHEKTANHFNPAGYRYFTGAVIPEIMVYEGKVVIRQSVYFFESNFPFNTFYRDLIGIIIGKKR